jgi:hypothetical protein
MIIHALTIATRERDDGLKLILSLPLQHGAATLPS